MIGLNTFKVREYIMGQFTQVHATKKYRLGTRKSDVAGNEYIYLKGVSSCAAGSWVSFDEAHVTTLAAANAQGRIAVAQAAVDASTKYGWFMIYGTCSALCLSLFADNGKVYLTSTAGSVDDTDVAGDVVMGAVGRSARNTTTGLATFELSYPMVMDLAID
jgi:hypothetical protein